MNTAGATCGHPSDASDHQMQSRAVYYTVKCTSLHSALADMDRTWTGHGWTIPKYKLETKKSLFFVKKKIEEKEKMPKKNAILLVVQY